MNIGLSNSKPKDSSAKLIFGDAALCAQFLRGYVNIPLLKDVQAEDIEDVTERFIHMFTEERNSDVVKRVYIKNKELQTPFYLISLIEHKSDVDYNVVMQVFRYMTFIWEDYEKEQEKRHEGISRTKAFRYPPILPILFYDGSENWTAATRLHDRILLSDVFGSYIPDYQCMLLQLKDYSNEELIERKDEISVILMIDKLQDMADFLNVSKDVDTEWLKDITKNSPRYLLEIMAQVIEGLLTKLNVPSEEIMEYTNQIKERRMGELLKHFKGYDVQAARRQMREEVQQEVREENIQILIKFGKKHGISKESIELDLREQYSLEGAEAAEKLALYW